MIFIKVQKLIYLLFFYFLQKYLLEDLLLCCSFHWHKACCILFDYAWTYDFLYADCFLQCWQALCSLTEIIHEPSVDGNSSYGHINMFFYSAHSWWDACLSDILCCHCTWRAFVYGKMAAFQRAYSMFFFCIAGNLVVFFLLGYVTLYNASWPLFGNACNATSSCYVPA